ncbi:hypothetical protein [Arthrobacter globiformis]|uniref:hypothetical protein n=1 Tax=Arthrobacter globiformis TaxID=1665 RepID=UPI00278EA8CE|nr:hypothetical protein [Arthrobacter globiformis]MDQ0619195.1 hypothetical protein [Arthrobacter globiformis]
MDEPSAAFTVAFPEARKTRAVSTLASIFFFVFWVLWGIDLFGPPELPDLPWWTIGLIPLALFLGCSIYLWRKQKELATLINQRFAEEFVAHTEDAYPQDVDILKVQRSIAVRRDDGSTFLWGVERKKDAFNVFPMK